MQFDIERSLVAFSLFAIPSITYVAGKKDGCNAYNNSLGLSQTLLKVARLDNAIHSL